MTTMINASEATIASLQLELENTVDKLKTECRTNLSQVEKECSSSVTSTAAAARAQCAVESARLQGERLGYIVSLHAEHNATLSAAEESCRQELEAHKAESLAQCEATIASQLAAKETECSDECRAHAVEIRDDATQEQNVTLAAVQANCDDALAALQERCDAELRLHLHPDIDVRTQERKSPEPCAVQTTVDDPLTSIMCQGYNEPFSNATFIDPEPNEVSVRLGNHLYIVSNQRVDNFETAWRVCRQRGMWLLALETLEEQTELIKLQQQEEETEY
ncbi:hypothetical protein B566_EDAN012985 [Ephemera danica]|nr:hypothetical protein B566_EDAN012985 [Ephemera danica]